MDEATLDRALGLLPLALTPTTPSQLAALAEAVEETGRELLSLSDQMDGTSSRLALIASALTGTITLAQRQARAAARRMAQLVTDEARAKMNTRERLLDSATDDTPGDPVVEAIQGEADEAGGPYCGGCGSLLPLDSQGWLCAVCEIADDAAGPGSSEGASAASAGGAGPTPLADFELIP